LYFKFGEQCLSDQWPPEANRVVPTHVVNLDLPAVERWKEVATVYKPQVRRCFNPFVSEDDLFFRLSIWLIISKNSFFQFHQNFNF